MDKEPPQPDIKWYPSSRAEFNAEEPPPLQRDPEERRQRALKLAVRSSARGSAFPSHSGRDVIARAKDFEAYLKGES